MPIPLQLGKPGIMAVKTMAGWLGLAFSDRGLLELRFPVPSYAEALEGLRLSLIHISEPTRPY
mgnify:CR=1 FL=1